MPRRVGYARHALAWSAAVDHSFEPVVRMHPSPVKRGARQRHRTHGCGDEDKQRDQEFVNDGPQKQRRRHQHRCDQDASGAERRAHRGGMHARVESLHPQKSQRADEGEEPAAQQEQTRGQCRPKWQSEFAHGSMTSPRNRNFASAVVPMKPNTAMRSATSKYTEDPERIPNISRVSMPLM